jgi:hypothetical protein
MVEIKPWGDQTGNPPPKFFRKLKKHAHKPKRGKERK